MLKAPVGIPVHLISHDKLGEYPAGTADAVAANGLDRFINQANKSIKSRGEILLIPPAVEVGAEARRGVSPPRILPRKIKNEGKRDALTWRETA